MRYATVAALAMLTIGEANGRGFGGARMGGAGVGRYGGAGVGGARAGSYTGPRGTTVQAGRVGGVGVGPLGGVHAGGASAARVTGPGGRSVTTGQRAGVSVGPAGGVRAGASRGTVARGPYGSTAVGGRAGVAVGPGGRVAAGASRGAVGVGPFGGVSAGGVRVGGVAGPRGVAVGHSTRYVSSTAFRSQAAVVRTGGAYGYRCFTPAWYRSHAVAWRPARWATPTFWVAPTWAATAAWCGITAVAPAAYDYGNSVVIQDDYVYIDGAQATTATAYAEQATQIADVGRAAEPPKEAEWRALGVFGLVQGEEKVAENIFQLAVDKSGVVRGNYYDALADNTLPVFGSVDKRTQRVAWSIGDKKEIVFEAGLGNLTREETTVLVHYGKDRTRQMALVRIPQPDETKE